jgi:GNAT superfamily N-acetyltransferase
MNAPVQIAECTNAEVEAFMARAWPPHNAPLGIDWVPQGIVLVARAGEPIAIARGVIIGGVGELKELLVEREHAKRGVGSRLLTDFERRCRAAGCHKLRLETADYQARPFYERHGFSVAATLENDRFGRDWFVMHKRL